MRVGLSVITRENQNIWENGLGQNVIYLAQLLRQIPFVEDVILLNCGDQSNMPVQVQSSALNLRLMAPREATDLVDVVIEMGGALDLEWLDCIRAMGKKVVFHCCGQPYAALIEPTVFKRDGVFLRAERCDEVWILPKDRVFTPMLRTLHRCPIYEVPYIWDPLFIEARAQELAQHGQHFGYQPRHTDTHAQAPRALRAAIFEPNISVTKVCTIPMMIAEHTWREDRACLSELHVLNSAHIKDHHTFQFMMNSFALARDTHVRLEARHDFGAYMAAHADAVISHHWQNDQNTLYLDALYGAYPLIHNSPWIGELGYYYPEFDVYAGASQLRRAAHEHDANFEHYRTRANAFLASLSPNQSTNQSAYAQRLLSLTSKAGAHHALSHARHPAQQGAVC